MSQAEEGFILILKALKVPPWKREYQFAKPRKFRADFAWPQKKYRLLVEIEGGIWTKGRHVRGKGYENDCLKYTLASLQGWRVFRFTPTHLKNGIAQQCMEWFFDEKKKANKR